MAGDLYWFPLSLVYNMLMVTTKLCWAFTSKTHLRCAVTTAEPRLPVPAVLKGRDGKAVWRPLRRNKLITQIRGSGGIVYVQVSSDKAGFNF